MPNVNLALSGANSDNGYTFSQKLREEDLNFQLRFVYDQYPNDIEQRNHDTNALKPQFPPLKPEFTPPKTRVYTP